MKGLSTPAARQLVLMLMRHGEAHQGGISDHARALTPQGVSDCQSIGQQLVDLFANTKIISSDATRTKQTSAEVCKFLTQSPISFDHDIYTASDANRLGDCIAKHAKSTDHILMVVGHNPAISQFASNLVGENIAFSTSDCLILTSEERDWDIALNSNGTWKEFKYLSP